MQLKNKMMVGFFCLAGCIVAVYCLWLLFRSVEIVAVHQRNNYSSILVKNFPFTDKGKIDWWLENKDALKAKYDIPKPASYGGFTITIWLFKDGYKEEGKYDRLCFDDMNTKINCIDKNSVFTIRKSKNRGITFTVDDAIYREEENGKIVRLEY
ncbi:MULTISPECIES: DUF943 family protein [Enterobacteriaceae]|uniref:DUF943 family protein n=1 Tax=Enterobacteriaceae TaxID=543 RepID=UPI0005520225|nr:DUF943 family protein [Enterobacter sp. Ag1]